MPSYLSGETEAEDAGPEDPDEEVRCDLAGNPLPRAARRPASSGPALDRPTASSALPLSSSSPPARPDGGPPPPPRSDFGAPAVWTPPPGYTSPPGFHLAPPVKAPVSSVSGTPLYAVLGGVVVGIVALTFALHTLKPKMVAAPTSYKLYTALDSSFACDRPAGWKTKEAGQPGGSRAMVSFTSGKVMVEVEADADKLILSNASRATAETSSSGSTNAGTENPGSPNPSAPFPSPMPQPMPLVQRMHEQDAQQWVDALPNFKEKAAEPFQSRFGDARVSEWTASKGNIKLHGYRFTTASSDRAVTVFCLSPERNWAVLMPTFQRIIESVGPGSG